MAPEERIAPAETRLLMRVALAIFTVTVAIGMFNGFHLIQLSREVLLTHVHAGTLGWITLVATGAALWLYQDAYAGLERHARGVAMGLCIVVPLYVLGFLSGVFVLKAIFGTLVLGTILGVAFFLIRGITRAGWSVPRLGVMLAFVTLIVGSTLGVLIQIEGATKAKFLPDAAVGGHASAQVGGYLVLFALSAIEWRLRGADDWGWAGRVQAALLFLGGILLAMGILLGIQPLLGIFIPLDIIAFVIFLFRVGPRVLGVRWMQPGSDRHYAVAVPWVLLNLGLIISVVVTAISQGFDKVNFNILIAADHAIFLGVMTNVAFGLMHDMTEEQRGIMPWTENVVFWVMNLALIGFIASLLGGAQWAEKFFVPFQGLAILVGIVAFSWRLSVTAKATAATV
jgi:hypothetical protein